MDQEEAQQVMARAAEFDDIVKSAVSVAFAQDPPEVAEAFIREDPTTRWNIEQICSQYQAGARYPLDRMPGVIDRFIDLKLQLYFTTRVLPGTENQMVYLRGFDQDNPLATPNLQLARLCYQQAMIGQSRVLWDRLMRSVHYLEVGADPAGKSIRRKFFSELPNWSPRWDVLTEWETVIDEFDQRYRTPEYHKGSVLKAELLGGRRIDPNRVLALLTPVVNGFWEVLAANIRSAPNQVVRLGRNVFSEDERDPN